jgi:NAD(P)H-hydrate epimerase
MQYITKKEIKLPKRTRSSHKGNNGRVLVVGGSKDYVGAVALAGLAALRSGADWVSVAVPENVGWAINALTADLVVKKYKGDDFSVSYAKDVLKLSNGFDAVLVGNGIGMHAKSFVKKYVKESNKLLVIDADGIKAISISDIDNAILTPHNRELGIFLKNSKIKKNTIKKIINEKNIKNKSLLIKKILNDKKNKNKRIIILLKGPVDAVISKDKVRLNRTGNAGMTKAGTGDVLAGLCAGFLAQSDDLFQSAVNGAYFNGLIGDILLRKKKGFTYLASDMVDEIKKIRK